jgi:hypothetical protein
MRNPELNLKNNVEIAQIIGAIESISKNIFALFTEFLLCSIKETVFIPSVKSWLITAIATIIHTPCQNWKPNQIQIQSMKLWNISATADKIHT